MVQDSAGFQSQQFVEQIAERRDRYSAQNIDTARNTWGQVGEIPGKFLQAKRAATQHRWQQEDRDRRNRQDAEDRDRMAQQDLLKQQQFEQEHALRRESVASDLATDQLHRQQAQEDLLWSQQLHQADMIGLQKEGLAADIALKKAQTQRAIDDLGGDRVPASMMFDQERMDYAISELGIMADPKDRKTRAATPDERSAASERRKAWLQQEQDFKLEQIERRNQGRGPSDDLDTSRKLEIAKDRIRLLQTELDNMQAPGRGASDEERDAYAKNRASIESELRQVSRAAFNMSGGAAPAQQKPEMTVDEFLSRQSADALKILYPDGK